MASIRRFRRVLLCAACVLLPGCILVPTGWDARTDGGRRDSAWDDPYRSGQPGVDDMRSKSQNSWGFFFGRR